MNIFLSVAAQDPHFSKMVRRIRPNFEPFFQAFSTVELVNPIHEAILIGLTDAKPSGYLEVIPNRDGFFQVIVGMTFPLSDIESKASLVSILEQVIQACPFSKPDKDRFQKLLSAK